MPWYNSSRAGAERDLIVQISQLYLTMYVCSYLHVCMYVCIYMLSCFRNVIMYLMHVHAHHSYACGYHWKSRNSWKFPPLKVSHYMIQNLRHEWLDDHQGCMEMWPIAACTFAAALTVLIVNIFICRSWAAHDLWA